MTSETTPELPDRPSEAFATLAAQVVAEMEETPAVEETPAEEVPVEEATEEETAEDEPKAEASAEGAEDAAPTEETEAKTEEDAEDAEPAADADLLDFKYNGEVQTQDLNDRDRVRELMQLGLAGEKYKTRFEAEKAKGELYDQLFATDAMGNRVPTPAFTQWMQEQQSNGHALPAQGASQSPSGQPAAQAQQVIQPSSSSQDSAELDALRATAMEEGTTTAWDVYQQAQLARQRTQILSEIDTRISNQQAQSQQRTAEQQAFAQGTKLLRASHEALKPMFRNFDGTIDEGAWKRAIEGASGMEGAEAFMLRTGQLDQATARIQATARSHQDRTQAFVKELKKRSGGKAKPAPAPAAASSGGTSSNGAGKPTEPKIDPRDPFGSMLRSMEKSGEIEVMAQEFGTG